MFNRGTNNCVSSPDPMVNLKGVFLLTVPEIAIPPIGIILNLISVTLGVEI